MNTEKLHFDNSKLDENGLASGTIERTSSGKYIKSVVYAIHPKISDDIGAELFVHEFNEVAIFETLIKIEREENLPRHKQTDISHNLNAEGDGEYTKERNLLHGYIRSDRLPTIDRAFTPEETDNFRRKSYS